MGSLPKRQRVAAYAVILRVAPGPDGEQEILLSRLAERITNDELWTLPGGGLDHGEDPRDAVLREVREETGLDADVGETARVYSAHLPGVWRDGRRVDAHALRIVYDGWVAPDTRACSLAWEADGSGFFYTRYPDGDEYNRTVHHHRLGADWRNDPVVWDDRPDPQAWPHVVLTPDGRWLVVLVEVGYRRTDVHVLDRQSDRWTTLISGVDDDHIVRGGRRRSVHRRGHEPRRTPRSGRARHPGRRRAGPRH